MEEKQYGVIYKITNILNQKVYIGQSINVQKRFNSYLNLNCKGQEKLYNALKKYGVDNFSFEIVGFALSKEELDELEIYYITTFNSKDREFGYNIRDGGSHGRLSEESKAKISEAKKGTVISEEQRKKISLTLKLNPKTQERLKKLNEANKGNSYAKGRKHTEEDRIKMSEAQKNSVLTKENLKRMSEGNVGRKSTEEHKQKISKALTGRKRTEEQNKRNSEAQKLRWQKQKIAVDKSA